MRKNCNRCGYPFDGTGILCKGCSNGHGTNRDDINPDLTRALDEIFDYTPPPEDNDEEE